MIATVAKMGTGTINDPIRPNTTAKNWQVIEERATEFVIEILD